MTSLDDIAAHFHYELLQQIYTVTPHDWSAVLP